MMGKDDFNKLNLKEQVEFINKNLDSKTLTEISKEIKISRSTIRERFLKQGYIFNKSQKENKCNNNTKALEEKIKILESKIEAIESELNNKNKEFNVIEIKKFEGKTVSRCYRVYEDIQKEFSKFCKENSNYKVQDILYLKFMYVLSVNIQSLYIRDLLLGLICKVNKLLRKIYNKCN